MNRSLWAGLALLLLVASSVVADERLVKPQARHVDDPDSALPTISKFQKHGIVDVGCLGDTGGEPCNNDYLDPSSGGTACNCKRICNQPKPGCDLTDAFTTGCRFGDVNKPCNDCSDLCTW
jgi:hypothetical protein